MIPTPRYESVTIVGPTASGKTRRAVELAHHFNGEIISADSRQVYCGMDLGTGKDLEDYADIKYHLIDVLPAGEKYNLYRYLADFNLAYNDILARNVFPIICGGSGMYVENAVNGVIMPDVPVNQVLRDQLNGKTLDELTTILQQYKSLHNTTDVDTVKRAVRAIEIQDYYRQHPEQEKLTVRAHEHKLNTLVIGILIDREERRKRISGRLQQRLQAGLVDEVKKLLDSGIPKENLIYYGLEYKYVTLYVTGALSYDEMYKNLETAIHQFAKRQMTWFRGMEKRGTTIHWFPHDINSDEFIERVDALVYCR